MITRYLRRLATFAGYVGRKYETNPKTGRACRMDPWLAWDLACIRHPSPAEAAVARELVDRAVDGARRAREERAS